MLKKFIGLVTLSTAAFAAGKCQTEAPFFKQGYPLSDQKYPAAYSAASRFEPRNECGYFFSGTFTYYRPYENGLEMGVITPTAAPVEIQYGRLKPSFDPGFKIGAGINLDQDDWILDFEYQRFHTTNRGSLTSENPSTDVITSDDWFVQTLPSVTFYQDLKARWKFKQDILDLNLSRPFYSGKSLGLTPILGLRGGWINQHYRNRATLTDDTVATARQRQKSWIIGFRPGITGNWNIGSIFRFVQDFRGMAFYQRFRTKYLQNDFTDPTTNYAVARQRRGVVNFGFESFSGVGLGGYLYNNRLNLDFLAGYRFQVLTEQNLMGISSTARASQENLSLQGFEATLKLTF